VVQVIGPVVDIEFPPESLPDIYNAIEIRDGSRERPLVVEVAQHLGDNLVRTVAMDTTDGLRRGVPAVDTGGPITVPVGEATPGSPLRFAGESH
jgi:F-type H+-transporting ATPase subunit beta